MTAPVVSLAERRASIAQDPSEESFSGEARCIACQHEWVAVVTVESETGESCGYRGDLECPACGCHRGQFKWPFEPGAGTEVWTCNCGSTCFSITLQGTRCVGCGKHAVFP